MQSGDTIGKYQLIRPLGRGGMGEVWLATATGHGGFVKNVVLKTLLPEYARDPMFIDMLANEARIGAKLSHPNLIEVFDFVAHDGTYLLAMEHVVGRPVHHIIQTAKQRRQQLPVELTLRVALDCCRGLEYAHDQGIIHCDLSPSNVMIATSGVCKILDFGVAHASAHGPRTERLKGKFSYMAPERIESLVTDRRTDVYALGVMMYLMLTGQLPFTGANDIELLQRIVTDAPVAPSTYRELDPRVEQLVMKAMRPDPAARHQNLKEVLVALAPLCEGRGAYSHEQLSGYVETLFDGRPATEDEVTHEADEADISSFVIDVDSDLALPMELPGPPRLPRAPRLPRPPRASTLPAALFAAGSETHETRTTVQSLFDRRPRSASPKIFEPAEPRNDPRDEPQAAWPWPISRVK